MSEQFVSLYYLAVLLVIQKTSTYQIKKNDVFITVLFSFVNHLPQSLLPRRNLRTAFLNIISDAVVQDASCRIRKKTLMHVFVYVEGKNISREEQIYFCTNGRTNHRLRITLASGINPQLFPHAFLPQDIYSQLVKGSCQRAEDLEGH